MDLTEPLGSGAPGDGEARERSAGGGFASPVVVTTTTRIELPTITIAKVLGAIAIVWLVFQIRHILLLIFLGGLIALVLDRPVSWLQARGVRRSLAVSMVLGAAVVLFGGLLSVLAPRVASDLSEFWNRLPTYVEQGLGWLQDRQPDLYDRVVTWARQEQEGLNAGNFNVRGLLGQGVGIVSGIGNVIITLTIAIYLLTDQGRSLNGLIRLLPPKHEAKFRAMIPGVAKVVNGYVVGQSINSVLFALFALAVLSLLGVPSVAVLALIAAIGDAVPQVGVILATIPAVLLAYTVSPQTALIVLIAYFVYQQIENYVTSPRVFARTLELPPLITLVSVLVGGSIMGMIGVLLALPVAAAIPVVWRIWIEAESEHRDVATDGANG